MEQNIPQKEQVQAVPTTVTAENKNMKMFAIGLAAILGVAVVASASVGVYRVYAKASTDNFSLVVAKVLRLPLMKVNGESVLYSNYADDVKAIQKLVAYDKVNQGNAAGLTSEQMSDQVLWRLANNILVKEAAAKFDVKVEAKDIEDLKANLLKQFKDQAEIDYYWEKLSAVSESEQCGWCKDKFGLSWQVVPENIEELMKNPGGWDTMMKQKKIVISEY